MPTANFVRDVKEVIRRLLNRGIKLEGNRAYPAVPTIDSSVESHTAALRAMREAIETHERRNPKAPLDSFVRLYELEDVLGGFKSGDGGAFAVDNVGSGARVHKVTESEGGVQTAKLRSILGEEGIDVRQTADEIVIGFDGAGPGTRPRTTRVGSAAVGCGASTVLTPILQLPALQVGDLMVWICITDHTRSNGMPLTVPVEWIPWYEPHYQGNGETFMWVHVYYKFATGADLLDTTSYTISTYDSLPTVCSYVFAYQNAHTSMPLSGFVIGTGDLFYPVVKGVSTNQDVVVISKMTNSDYAATAWPGGTVDVGIAPDIEYYQSIPKAGSWNAHFHIATRNGGSIATDENLIAGESTSASMTDPGWTHYQHSGFSRWGLCTQFDGAAAGSGRHYSEYTVNLVAGRKYIFAANHFYLSYNYIDRSEVIGLGFVDPDGLERSQAFRITGYPASSARIDDGADYGTTWQAHWFGFVSGGTPSATGRRMGITFTAQKTGAYKVRVSSLNSDSTDVYYNYTGATSDNFLINGITFREGWMSPVITHSTAGAVVNGSANRDIHTWGWKNISAGDRYARIGFAITPAWADLPPAIVANNAGPYAALSSYSPNVPADFGMVEEDGLTINGGYTRGDAAIHAFPDRSITYAIGGVRQKYHFECKVTATGGNSDFIFGIVPHGLGRGTVQGTNGYWWRYQSVSNTTKVMVPFGTEGTMVTVNAGTAGVPLANDVYGCTVDFTVVGEVTFQLWRNGVLANTHTHTFSSNYGILSETQWWCAWFAPKGGSYYDNWKTVTANLTGPFAYPPAGSYVPYDTHGVAGATAGSIVETTAAVDGQVLTWRDAVGQWIAEDTQWMTPTTTLGDLIARGTTVDERLPVGSEAQTLQVIGGVPAWGDPVNPSPTTTAGDLIVRGATADERLPVGAEAQHLTIVGGTPTWTTIDLTPTVHDEPLTDGGSNFIFAAGDVVVVVGVPNP
jgi:hypothetical protein